MVTALGIKRSEKALSYNVQKVGGENLTTVKNPNFMNSLAGKVAGVNINASSTGMGGAARVVMRGPKSITRSNQALYVIDGVPINNTSQGEISGGAFSSQPGSEGIADINPEDNRVNQRPQWSCCCCPLWFSCCAGCHHDYHEEG